MSYPRFGLRSLSMLGLVGVLAACQGASLSGQSSGEVVYSDDNRLDAYAEPDPRYRAIAEDSAVALIPSEMIDQSNPNDVRVIADSLA